MGGGCCPSARQPQPLLRARLGCTRGGSPGIFGKSGGNGSSPSPASRSRSHHSSRRSTEPAPPACMPSHGSPAALSRSGTVSDREVARVGGLELLPADRARHRRVGEGARAVGPGHRAVAVRLVEVDEDAGAAFLLPPRGGDLLGHPALEFARGRDDGVAHVEELPGRLDRGKDVQPAVARGLDEGLQPGLGEYAPQLPCDRNGIGEAGAGLRVEVDPQLVRIVRVARPGRPRGGTPPCSSAPPTPRRRFRR